ncbi:hypothetical protein J2S00_000409 [Caldalkalibacillus uzonensis]|uniref:DUF2487 family protein n=1 Tax=Caldalkalibacillus uzonensis TaxID=353224 RepID=A0ABU0CP26_9BACI|nr:DUF2487 family protein [Caldalkalibacillus uzonensis]MDQ0337639.1 hypothetical protein [Caldalkalibacillus uzonensis]
MKWDRLTIDDYIENKAYIDTALVPLFKVKLGPSTRESALQATWLSGVINHIEEQLAGRVLLLPPVTYAESHQEEELVTYLNRYTDDVLQNGFQHQVYITVDDMWKKKSEMLTASLLYIDLHEVDVEDQSSQTLFNCAQKYVPKLISLWKRG